LKPLVFIHIPKTAGTTLISYLDGIFDLNYINQEVIPKGLLCDENFNIDSQYQFYRGHFFLSHFVEHGFDVAATNYVTFLRDPIKRIESWFKHYEREKRFLTLDGISPLLVESNAMTMMLSPLPLHSSKYAMRDHLEAAKEVLLNFYFVGFQEDFEVMANSLFSKLGAPHPGIYETNRKSNHSVSIDVRLIAEINERNWADIELYEYARKHIPVKNDLNIWQDTRPLVSEITWTAANPLLGRNWHSREGVGTHHPQLWRWTGPDNISTIYFNLRAGNYRLEIRVVNAMAPDILEGLKFSINDQPIAPSQSRDELWGIVFTACIAHEHDQSPLCLSIIVPRTLKFSEVDASVDDDRACGVAITEITFKSI